MLMYSRFRWAFCQLDILKRLHTIPEIRLALTQLPKTLDETYERILCNIPSESRSMVHRILNLIGTGFAISLEQLSDLLAVNLENLSFDRQNRPFDIYAPVETCTCLLTYNVDTGNVNLAHYTVKEYLNSPRICDGPAKMFHTTDDSLYAMAASTFMIYMLFESYDIEHQPLVPLAISVWYQAIQNINSKAIREALSPLVIQLLSPTEAHYPKWQKEVLRQKPESCYPLWFTAPGAECSAILASLCWLGLNDAAELLLNTWKDSFPFGEPLYWSGNVDFHEVDFSQAGHEISQEEVKEIFLTCLKDEFTGHEILTVTQVALMNFKNFGPDLQCLLELMISRGADFNMRSLTGFGPLNSLLHYRSRRQIMIGVDLHSYRFYLDFLLAHGCRAELSGCTITPLQSAIVQVMELASRGSTIAFYCGVIQKLLDSGTTLNGVADDKVNSERIQHTYRYLFQQYTEYSSVWQEESEYVSSALYDRGTSLFYDTPLRLLRDRWKRRKRTASSFSEDDKVMKGLAQIEYLLLSYGAKSLHLFPVKGLPGYVEEDMEEWNKLNASTVVTSPSSSTAGPLADTSVKSGLAFVRCTIP
jgi:hypothetical protein